MKTYLLKHNKFDVRINSRSGGAFSLLSDVVLENGGVVYGVILDSDLNVVHSRAQTKSERDKMCESKYVQSDKKDIICQVYDDIAAGKTVLFSGTPCEVDGLKNVITNDKLYTVDIVCHGVPSPKIYRDYLEYNESIYGEKIKKIFFRNKKKYGWEAHVESLLFESGKMIDSKIYTTLFYNHKIIRPSCFSCRYKSIQRVSDITIADAWGVEKKYPEFNDDNGVSLVIVNTKNGDILFEAIKQQCDWIEVDINDFMQPPLVQSFKQPNDRKQFWKYYNRKGFKHLIRRENVRRVGKAVKRFIVSKGSEQ